MKITGIRYAGTEWSGEEDFVVELKEGKSDVSVWITHPDRVRREGIGAVMVLWDGAVDFEGNKKEFKVRYKDIYKLLKEKGYLK